MFHLDRDKYFQILKAQGLSAALTALHRDQTGFEFETFEGQEGWQPASWDKLEDVRKLSRELWEIGLRHPEPDRK